MTKLERVGLPGLPREKTGLRLFLYIPSRSIYYARWAQKDAHVREFINDKRDDVRKFSFLGIAPPWRAPIQARNDLALNGFQLTHAAPPVFSFFLILLFSYNIKERARRGVHVWQIVYTAYQLIIAHQDRCIAGRQELNGTHACWFA